MIYYGTILLSCIAAAMAINGDCVLPKDEGTKCGYSASMKTYTQVMWYFNYNSGQCEAFRNKGCGGNRNKFLTLENCDRVCGSGDIWKPLQNANGKLKICTEDSECGSGSACRKNVCLKRADICTQAQKIETLNCKGSFNMGIQSFWAYNSNKGQCEKIEYHDACTLATDNGFQAESDCNQLCSGISAQFASQEPKRSEERKQWLASHLDD